MPGSPAQEPDGGTDPPTWRVGVASVTTRSVALSPALPVPLPLPLLFGLAPASRLRAICRPATPWLQRLGQRVGQALGAVEHDHLVDVAERLGRRLDDGRPVLGELLADDRVLVLGQGVGPGLDGLGLGHALGPHGLALGQALGLGGVGLGLADAAGGLGPGARPRA